MYWMMYNVLAVFVQDASSSAYIHSLSYNALALFPQLERSTSTSLQMEGTSASRHAQEEGQAQAEAKRTRRRCYHN